MEFRKFTDPFTGCEFSALEFDDNSLLFDMAFDKQPCAVSYDAESDMYLIPATAFRHKPTVTLTQAANILSVSKARVSTLCAKGQLKHERINGTILIEWESLDEYATERKRESED